MSSEMSSNFHLEIACFDTESVLLADRAGADRTEFCADRASGGVTPPLQEALDILPLLRNPVHIMVRPRGGDFLYSDTEFEQMKHDIRIIKTASSLGGLAGFVFGILDANRRVDVVRNSELVELARPLWCTFHRAFDDVKELNKGLEDVVICGFKAILTSGGATDAVSGADVLDELVTKANARIEIMPGGSVRSSNIKLLMDKTKARWYHSSAFMGDEISGNEVGLLKQLLEAET